MRVRMRAHIFWNVMSFQVIPNKVHTISQLPFDLGCWNLDIILFMYVRKISFLFVYFYAHFKHMRVLNFLTEPDTDIFIENKNVPYGRFS